MDTWRGRQRWAGWLAMLVIGLAALAPTVSRALAAQGGTAWIEVCSAQGMRWIAVPAEGANTVPTEPPPQAIVDLDHCGLCLLAAHGLAPPPAAAPPWRASPPRALFLSRAAPRAAPATLRLAQPRGPPALAPPSFRSA